MMYISSGYLHICVADYAAIGEIPTTNPMNIISGSGPSRTMTFQVTSDVNLQLATGLQVTNVLLGNVFGNTVDVVGVSKSGDTYTLSFSESYVGLSDMSTYSNSVVIGQPQIWKSMTLLDFT